MSTEFFEALVGTGIFGLIGLVYLFGGMVGGFKLLDKVIFPKVHFQDELQKGNVAVSIVVGLTMTAMLLSIAFIIGNVVK